MRLDFEFLKGGGYVIARRKADLELPPNYAFAFRLRGRAPSNHLEFKLVDSTGANVWWCVKRDVAFADEWRPVKIRKRQISFAWGPQGGGEIHRVAAIELAITAGSGGAGSVWIDDLELVPLPPADAAPPAPVAGASSSQPGSQADKALDGDAATSWRSRTGDAAPWLSLDLGGAREFGGIAVEWDGRRHAADYDIETSENGRLWSVLREVRGGNGGRDLLHLPESEARHLRLRVVGGCPSDGIAVREVTVQAPEWAPSREAFFEALAKEAPRGTYPRAFAGEQVYWTVVGDDISSCEGLLSEDGMLETGKASFSIEPFLHLGDSLVAWSDVEASRRLEDGFLPIPSVAWRHRGIEFSVTAVAAGTGPESSILARYRIRNGSPARIRGTFYLALRPFQVNPPAQFLNTPGGTARVDDIAVEARGARVGNRIVWSLTRWDGFGAVAFDGGDIVADYLREGRIPAASHVTDPFGAASAAFAYELDLSPGGQREVDLLIPLCGADPPPGLPSDAEAAVWVEKQLEEQRLRWVERIGGVTFDLPENAGPIVRSLRSQVAYLLINRAGPAIQPGARSYARSWIRDGALASSSLLRLGHADVVRQFLDWYAPFVYENGKAPCVVDARGADPVPEHDSSSQFIFLVAEYYRFSKDGAALEEHWPRVAAAAAYLDSLRQLRRTPEYLLPGKKVFYGLLPESISHEGYSAKPMHSYWDDFFALRGFEDAAFLAGVLGHEEERIRLEAVAREFRRDLLASIGAAAAAHAIPYIPGCADLGDFDATSTAIALSPLGFGDILPRSALQATFDRYMEFFRARRDGASWEAYTPYELRVAAALVRLGRRDEAHELFDYFFRDQRPPEWNHWAEVVWREYRLPRFIGDMPHTWVGMEFVRSVLDLFAYEREADSALVVGAGVPWNWVSGEGGIAVRGLRTVHGPLSYSMKTRAKDGALLVRLEAGLEVPAGGLVVRSPGEGPVRDVTINGKGVPAEIDGGIRVGVLPADIVVRR